jgi:hypothetical protein
MVGHKFCVHRPICIWLYRPIHGRHESNHAIDHLLSISQTSELKAFVIYFFSDAESSGEGVEGTSEMEEGENGGIGRTSLRTHRSKAARFCVMLSSALEQWYHP